ncbi:MAG: glycoside hydrolase family 28 protein [Acholeplasmatales bacterium]|nr:glycoside hydrolase family 28 protein [Acholeplasmatales bacterium]
MLLLYLSSRTVSIELDSNNPFYHNGSKIYLNDNLIGHANTNVITLYDLEPDTKYNLKIDNDFVSFKTKSETACFNIKSFNAAGDGITDDTSKIQSAISTAPKGALIYIPEGTYLVSSLYLKSDISIYLEKGATILAQTERKCYPVHPGLTDEHPIGIWEGTEQDNFASIFNLIDVKNVDIIGEGTIDGQAENGDWYIDHRNPRIAWRGHLLFTERSENIHIIGLNFYHSQSWSIHPYMSENIDIINVNIKNNPHMPTTDGIDPDCIKHMRILGSTISVGDDCIAIKSGTYKHALKYKASSSDILIRNNLMIEGHGGVVFGSELSGGINNIIVTNCVFKNTDRGLRIKTRRGRGHIGTINNIKFDNIIMDGVKTPFVINMYYNMGDKGGHDEYAWTKKKLPFNELTPVLGDFEFSNMNCTNVEYAAGVFLGLPESKIDGIKLKNIKFSYNNNCSEGSPAMIEHNFKLKNAGIYASNCVNISFNDVEFSGIIGEEIIREESDN